MASVVPAASHFSPPAVTAIAHSWDTLYGFLLIASFISCVLVIGGFIYFAVKYRRKGPDDKTPYISHNTTLEFLWSFIPFVIFMFVFVWGWVVYYQMRTMPKNALEITVEAQKWDWSFVYKNGRRSAGEFYVPVGQPVKMVMTSKDVLHSFYVPAFRNKQDVVPGRYTTLWYQADVIGDYQVFCAEYCGDNHSGMKAKVHVVSLERYEEWLSTEAYKGLAGVDIGKKVYESRCVACHSLDKQGPIAPTWKGLFGRHEQIQGGGEIVVDENYIRESIMNPNAKVVAGFNPVMPSFAGQLSEEEIMGVIDFIKTVK